MPDTAPRRAAAGWAALALLACFAFAGPAFGAGIEGPIVSVIDNSVQVSARVVIDEKQSAEIEKGSSKEVVIYVDLFRVWDMWLDEFVAGTSATRTIRCDPVKKEYTASSLTGRKLTEKRFGTCREMLGWALGVQGWSVASTNALEPAGYFVRVTAEGRRRKRPPFMGLLFFFVPDEEFKEKADSPAFDLNQR